MATKKKVTASINAQNTYSDAVAIDVGPFQFTLSGTWTATVTVQRYNDITVGWDDVDTFTTNTVQVGYCGAPANYRFGVKTGDFTVGPLVGVISQ